MADKDQLEAIKKLLQDNNKLESEALRIQKEKKEAAQEYLRQRTEESKKISQRVREEIEEIERKIILGKKEIKQSEDSRNLDIFNTLERKKALDSLKDQLKEKNKALKEQNGYIKEATIALKEQVQEYERLKKVQKDLNKTADSAPDFIKGMFSGKVVTSGISKFGNMFQKSLVNKMKVAAGSATTLSAGLSAMLGPAAILAVGLYVVEILKLAVSIGDAENAFMKTTGANEEFARGLSNSYEETRKFGGSIGDVDKSMTSLFMNFTDFTFQNEKTRESLTNTATVLAKLGVSTDDFSKSIQNMTKAMGMNAEGAAQQLLNLEKFAEELGVAPSKIASDFAGAGGTLAKFGEQGVQAFKDLQIASKVTGLEMQRILNITDKFDTFEGAATQAGKLNAALGGNFVNAMDLMMSTDPVERFEQIRGAILNAGLSFDEMSYYQKNFYKDSLGLNDVGELALMLSGRTDLLSESFDKSSQSYEDAAERAKTVASFQEQLNILFAEMIPILTPLIDLMRVFFTILGPFAEGIGLISRAIGSPIGLATMITILSPKLYALGAAMWAALGPWALLPAAIFAVVSAIGYFNKMAFHERNSPTFFEGLGMMPEMFSDWGGEVELTAKSMQGMGKTIESTPIPAAAETLAGTTNSRANASFSGGDAGMQTVRQPMEINLNGDKLEKFIVEVLGANIKKISILQ